MSLKMVTPAANAMFQITAEPEWPSLVFRTDGNGQHIWKWSIVWKTFSRSGTVTTPSNQWDAKTVVANLGGMLTLQAIATSGTATLNVKLTGVNPAGIAVTTYIGTKPNASGFDKILAHETKFRHFNLSGEPLKSFDNGYGMSQLTNPIPSFEQIWNWKLNVDAGIALFEGKITSAKSYLSQSGRVYTADQLKYESVCRWNGGHYHTWDVPGKKWVRNPNIFCDTATGNIGWDMTDQENKGKSETQLHARDKGKYSSPPDASAHWRYYGVCYADQVLK